MAAIGCARNPIGMLRRAIEENWEAPVGANEPADPAATAFAKVFYGGKREGTSSLSEPSRRDLEAADRLVHQLSKIYGTRDPIRSASWGRGFGRQFPQQYPNMFPSLAYAAPVLIDDLVRSHQRQAESAQIRTQLDLKSTSSNATPDSEIQLWLDYLAQKEPEVKKRFPSIYKAFESNPAALQTEFKRFGMPGFEQRMIDHHNRPATRLADLQKAFPEHLLDFEAWQRQHENQTTLSTNT